MEATWLLAGVAIFISISFILSPCVDFSCHATELKNSINSTETAIFLKYLDGVAVGFAQCNLRHDYVEGTDSSPVGYLEGIFVNQKYRKSGFARELLSACEQWAKECGCREFVSDCELNNFTSLSFHLKSGFTEVNRIICFKKNLT